MHITRRALTASVVDPSLRALHGLIQFELAGGQKVQLSAIIP